MALSTISPAALKMDGRRQRSERTRQAIILAAGEMVLNAILE